MITVSLVSERTHIKVMSTTILWLHANLFIVLSGHLTLLVQAFPVDVLSVCQMCGL